MSKHILMVLTSHDDLAGIRKTGFYVPEAAHPHAVFKQAGYQVDFVSPQGGQPPMDGLNLENPEQKAFLEDPEVKSKLSDTLAPDQVDASLYQAIFYVGGHGTMWDFADNQNLAELAAAIVTAQQGDLNFQNH